MPLQSTCDIRLEPPNNPTTTLNQCQRCQSKTCFFRRRHFVSSCCLIRQMVCFRNSFGTIHPIFRVKRGHSCSCADAHRVDPVGAFGLARYAPWTRMTRQPFHLGGAEPLGLAGQQLLAERPHRAARLLAAVALPQTPEAHG